MKLTIHNPDNLKTIDYTELQETQGNLKDLSEQNYVKLRSSIEKHGWIAPITVWIDKDNNHHLIDGHQRLRLLRKEAATPKAIPYVQITAGSLEEAAEILLKYTSQYGTVTQEGLDEFIQTYDLPEAILPEVNFDSLPDFYAKPEGVEHIDRDKDFFSPEDEYEQNSVNQIILIYDNERFKHVVDSFKEMMAAEEFEAGNPSELVYELLRYYEDSKS